MFKCQRCGRTTNPGEKLARRIVETRDKVYTNSFEDNRGRIFKKDSKGYEIIREIGICERCDTELGGK